MVRPTFVSAEDGKKGLSGPAPSPSMVSGGSVGFTMRKRSGYWRFSRARTTAAARTATTATPTTAAAARRSREEARRADAAIQARTRAEPAAAVAMWVRRIQALGRVAPMTVSASPETAATASSKPAARSSRGQSRHCPAHRTTAATVRASPRPMCRRTLVK